MPACNDWLSSTIENSVPFQGSPLQWSSVADYLRGEWSLLEPPGPSVVTGLITQCLSLSCCNTILMSQHL